MSPLPRYPLPSREHPDDAAGGRDWRLFGARVGIHRVLAFFLLALFGVIAIIWSNGQVMLLLDRLF